MNSDFTDFHYMRSREELKTEHPNDSMMSVTGIVTSRIRVGVGEFKSFVPDPNPIFHDPNHKDNVY